MNRAWEKVYQFHQAFSVPYQDRPTFLPPDRVKKRAEWMIEEIKEFQASQTVTAQADAMIDLMYFAMGTLVEMGVRPERLFEIVHQANMSKLWENGKPRYRASDGKIIKPPKWQPPEPLLQEELKKQKNSNSRVE